MPRPAILDMIVEPTLLPDEVREYAVVDPLDTVPEEVPESDEPPPPPASDEPQPLVRVDLMRASRLRAAAALSRGSSVRQAAIAAGVTPSQVRGWMKLPEFVARQKKLEDETLSRYQRLVNHSGVTAVGVHRELMAPTATITASDGTVKEVPLDPELRLKAAARVMTSADRALDRVKGNPDQDHGPLIVFPPGTKIAILAQPPEGGPQ